MRSDGFHAFAGSSSLLLDGYIRLQMYRNFRRIAFAENAKYIGIFGHVMGQAQKSSEAFCSSRVVSFTFSLHPPQQYKVS
jgi:hypothetical protein